MSQKNTAVALAVTAAFAASLSAPVLAAENPFAAKSLENGYQVSQAAEKKAEEKKAEGKCGGDKKAEGKCGGDKKKDGKCAADKKKKDGKCGEGKCGGDKKKAEEKK